MKVLIIDIDQVLANSSQRYRLGLEYVSQQTGQGALKVLGLAEKKDKQLFYSDQAFFNPEYIQFDTLTSEAPVLWRMMEFVNHTIVLTPRPHWLQHATEKWLKENALWNDGKMTVVCKDYSGKVKYLTNVEWVAIMMLEALKAFELIYFCSQGKGINQEVNHRVAGSGYVRVADTLEVLVSMVQNDGNSPLYSYEHEYTVACKFSQAHTLQGTIQEMLKNGV